MHIGENLKRIRTKIGMEQGQLAEKTEISVSQISRLESGKQKNPTIETVVNLAAVLGVSIEELVFGEKNPHEISYLMKAVEKMDEEDKKFAKKFLKTCVLVSQSKSLEE